MIQSPVISVFCTAYRYRKLLAEQHRHFEDGQVVLKGPHADFGQSKGKTLRPASGWRPCEMPVILRMTLKPV